MAEHSPLPWRLERDKPSRVFTIYDANGKALMCDERYYPWCPDSPVDWMFIVTTVNAHADLLAALRVCRSALNEAIVTAGDLDHPTIRAYAKAAEQADAALAKAEAN